MRKSVRSLYARSSSAGKLGGCDLSIPPISSEDFCSPTSGRRRVYSPRLIGLLSWLKSHPSSHFRASDFPVRAKTSPMLSCGLVPPPVPVIATVRRDDPVSGSRLQPSHAWSITRATNHWPIDIVSLRNTRYLHPGSPLDSGPWTRSDASLWRSVTPSPGREQSGWTSC